MSSISEIAERICRHNLDSERVSVTQFCDIQAAIEKALRDERERAAKIAEAEYASPNWHLYYRAAAINIATAIRKED